MWGLRQRTGISGEREWGTHPAVDIEYVGPMIDLLGPTSRAGAPALGEPLREACRPGVHGFEEPEEAEEEEELHGVVREDGARDELARALGERERRGRLCL